MRRAGLLDIGLAMFWSFEFLRFAFGDYQPSNFTIGFVLFFIAFYFINQCFKVK